MTWSESVFWLVGWLVDIDTRYLDRIGDENF